MLPTSHAPSNRSNTATVGMADRLLRADPTLTIFSFDIEILRNGEPRSDPVWSSGLTVRAIDVGKRRPLFPRNGTRTIKVKMLNRASVAEETTFNYTMLLRFYDAKCTATKPKPAGYPLSKDMRCVVYSLPLASQNVTHGPHHILSPEEEAALPPHVIHQGPIIEPAHFFEQERPRLSRLTLDMYSPAQRCCNARGKDPES